MIQCTRLSLGILLLEVAGEIATGTWFSLVRAIFGVASLTGTHPVGLRCFRMLGASLDLRGVDGGFWEARAAMIWGIL
jgi:hypothetical protein